MFSSPSIYHLFSAATYFSTQRGWPHKFHRFLSKTYYFTRNKDIKSIIFPHLEFNHRITYNVGTLGKSFLSDYNLLLQQYRIMHTHQAYVFLLVSLVKTQTPNDPEHSICFLAQKYRLNGPGHYVLLGTDFWIIFSLLIVLYILITTVNIC